MKRDHCEPARAEQANADEITDVIPGQTDALDELAEVTE